MRNSNLVYTLHLCDLEVMSHDTVRLCSGELVHSRDQVRNRSHE